MKRSAIVSGNYRKSVHLEQTSQCENILDLQIPLWYFSRKWQKRHEGSNMTNELKPKKLRSVAKYRRVEIADLKTGRHGKHHDLVQGIVQELMTLRPGSALEIPLADGGGVGLATLRSGVHRAATSSGLRIATGPSAG